MEPQSAPAAPGVLARLSSHLDWYWTLSPPGRAAFWATFGGWALDAYNQMTVGFVLPAVTTAFALSTTQAGLLGTVAREARTASLLAVLVVLPVVFLGLVPRGAIALAYWVSLFLPFAHAVRLFGAALYDTSPWRTVGRELLWLVGLGALFGALARLATRRLLT